MTAYPSDVADADCPLCRDAEAPPRDCGGCNGFGFVTPERAQAIFDAMQAEARRRQERFWRKA